MSVKITGLSISDFLQVQIYELRVQNNSFGLTVTGKENVHHETEPENICFSKAENPRMESFLLGGEDVKNNKGLGVVEIILILTILIVFVLVFGEKLASLISQLMAVL